MTSVTVIALLKLYNFAVPSLLIFLHYFLFRCAKPLDVIAIDHLPSVLPRESSQRFANKMTPYLLRLGDVSIYNNSLLILSVI